MSPYLMSLSYTWSIMHVFERFRSPHTEQLSLCSPFLLQSIFSAKHKKSAQTPPGCSCAQLQQDNLSVFQIGLPDQDSFLPSAPPVRFSVHISPPKIKCGTSLILIPVYHIFMQCQYAVPKFMHFPIFRIQCLLI